MTSVLRNATVDFFCSGRLAWGGLVAAMLSGSSQSSHKRRVYLTSVGENTHHPSVDAVSRNYTSSARIHISRCQSPCRRCVLVSKSRKLKFQDMPRTLDSAASHRLGLRVQGLGCRVHRRLIVKGTGLMEAMLNGAGLRGKARRTWLCAPWLQA